MTVTMTMTVEEYERMKDRMALADALEAKMDYYISEADKMNSERLEWESRYLQAEKYMTRIWKIDPKEFWKLTDPKEE